MQKNALNREIALWKNINTQTVLTCSAAYGFGSRGF